MERVLVTNCTRIRIRIVLLLFVGCLCCGIEQVAAQSIGDWQQKFGSSFSVPQTAIPLKTLGGKQFWTDDYHCGGWRIQQNVISETFRLLDPENKQHGSGAREDCLSKLEEFKRAGRIQPISGRVVVVLHGLIRTTDSMRMLGQYLQENGDFTAVDFEYASTRRPMADHAAALARVIDSLGDSVTEINFVGHSMGNIVVRHYLADLAEQGGVEKRFGRMVMIGPPNQGSKMARVLRWSLLFNVVAGSAGTQLGIGWPKLEPQLATPSFEFGIIAGGQADGKKFSNLLLEGKDDFTVSLDEARLNGATDFLVEPLFHSTMMRQPVTLESTLRFLNHGYFVSAQERNPIR